MSIRTGWAYAVCPYDDNGQTVGVCRAYGRTVDGAAGLHDRPRLHHSTAACGRAEAIRDSKEVLSAGY